MRTAVNGIETFWHEEPSRGPAPVLYVHGVPTSADLWLPFLERTGGVALDLPGFGRSDKPQSFDYSIPGYRDFLRAFVDERGLERFSLVVHDWGGGLGLGLAQSVPERVERLVVIDAVPLLPGYRWHRIARIWQTPVIGELAMGFTTKWGLRRASRAASESGRPMPKEFLDLVWRHWDQGTMRAILKLYRSAPAEVLEREGGALGSLRERPSLVLWGERDPYLPTSFASAYAEALDAELELVEHAGHWPWIDQPHVVDRVAGFLLG